jgi:hypothetical protein
MAMVRAEHGSARRFGYGAQCVVAGVVVALLMLAVMLSPVSVL